MKYLQIVFILALLGTTLALYDANSKVVKLTKENFNKLVMQSTDLWIVEFYAPWCGHCKSLAPEYDKAAKALEGIVKLGAVDMTTDESVGGPYGIKGFPTIKFFGAKKQSPADYNGQRTAQGLVDFAFEERKNVAYQKIGARGGSSNQNNQGGGGGGAEDKDVVVLTDAEFDEKVLKGEDAWFVEFYAPWCGHCKSLAPHWNKLATELKDELKNVKIAKVDATVHSKSAGRYGVKGYPSIKFFPGGKKSGDGSPIDYDGARDQASMSEWLKVKTGSMKPQSVDEIANQQQFNDECAEYKGICVFVFLPHILDSSAVERNKYIAIVLDAAKVNKGRPFKYFWLQGGDQFELEESFRVGGAGYPATLAYSATKNLFTNMRGALNAKNLDNFIKTLVTNKAGFESYKSQIKFKTVTPWDGQDKKVESGTSNEDL